MSLLLKIHHGLHAGAKLALADGEYNVGASDECEIILADPGVKDHHLRLRIEKGQAHILVYEGADATVDGRDLGADEVALEPFQEVRAGATWFRLGPEDAEWPDLAQPEPEREEAGEPAAAEAGEPGDDAKRGGDTRRVAKPFNLPFDVPPDLFRRRSVKAAIAVLALIIVAAAVYRLTRPSEGELRARAAADVLEARGYAVADADRPATGTMLRVVPTEKGVAVEGAVDYARQILQLQNVLRENGIEGEMRLASRDDSLRKGQQYLLSNNIPMELVMQGKTRVTVHGFAETPALAQAVVDELGPILAGFETIESEILDWPSTKQIIDGVLARHRLDYLEASPHGYEIVILGRVRERDADNRPQDGREVWKRAEDEIANLLRFRPQFDWRPSPANVRDEVDDAVARLNSGLSANLAVTLVDRETIRVSGFVRDPEVAARVGGALPQSARGWKDGKLVEEYVYWDGVREPLAGTLDRNGLGDFRILEPEEFRIVLMGSLNTPDRQAAWDRALIDLARLGLARSNFELRSPPPPEEAWLRAARTELERERFAFVEPGQNAVPEPSSLNLVRRDGSLALTGAVETEDELRRLQALAKRSGHSFDVELKVRAVALERAQRFLADLRARVRFERQGDGGRLIAYGYIRDLDAGRKLLDQLGPYLDCFPGVEEKFVTWGLLETPLKNALAEYGLDVKVAPEEYRLVADGALPDEDSRVKWERTRLTLDEMVGAEVLVEWQAPLEPGQARPEDVARRLRELNFDAVVLAVGDRPSPFALSVQQDRNLIRVMGVVEENADRLRIQSLYDEGMLHLVVDVKSREEMLRQAERYLAEVEATVAIRRVGGSNVVLAGYVVDIATGAMLREELAKILTGFASVETDFIHWADIRPALVRMVESAGLERLYIQPDEFLIYVVGILETAAELEAWEATYAAVVERAEAPVRFSWHAEAPVMRLGRFARRLARSPQAIAPTLSAIEDSIIGRKQEPPPPPEELARIAAEEKERRAEEEGRPNWRMRVVEVRSSSGGGYAARFNGMQGWYQEGDVVQGYLLLEVFRDGVMLLRDDNTVIYTIEEEIATQSQSASGDPAGK